MRFPIVVTLVMALVPALSYAQQAPQSEVDQVLTQIHQLGCNAEEQASAQTIANLQKQVRDLKAQVAKLDPPKSGATKK